MTTSSSFKILRIRALLRLNGSLDGVEAILCKCGACAKESRLSRGHGLQDVPAGIQLTCPDCHASAEVLGSSIWMEWAEQLRRDRVLIAAGINPDDLYGP